MWRRAEGITSTKLMRWKASALMPRTQYLRSSLRDRRSHQSDWASTYLPVANHATIPQSSPGLSSLSPLFKTGVRATCRSLLLRPVLKGLWIVTTKTLPAQKLLEKYREISDYCLNATISLPSFASTLLSPRWHVLFWATKFVILCKSNSRKMSEYNCVCLPLYGLFIFMC